MVIFGRDAHNGVMSEFPSSLEMLKAKFDDPTFQSRMTGFSKAIQFKFSDLKEDFLFTVQDGKSAMIEKKEAPQARIVISTTNETFLGIMNKTVDPTAAYFGGQLNVQGDMDELMSLQPLMM